DRCRLHPRPRARSRARAEHHRGLRGLPRRRHPLGAPARVPDLRQGRLLRLLAAAARQPARRGGRAPGHPVVRAGRALALVLRGPGRRL
ncbi:MAG: hypothetical protein AVDCRST_MAG41-3007, partial [uncultured Corynebacteriales bacterium]